MISIAVVGAFFFSFQAQFGLNDSELLVGCHQMKSATGRLVCDVKLEAQEPITLS